MNLVSLGPSKLSVISSGVSMLRSAQTAEFIEVSVRRGSTAVGR